MGGLAGLVGAFPLGVCGGVVLWVGEAPGMLLCELCGVVEGFGHLVEQGREP